MISPINIPLTDFKKIGEAVEMALVALLDQDAILRRGHFGREDRKEAKKALRVARDILEDIAEKHKG